MWAFFRAFCYRQLQAASWTAYTSSLLWSSILAILLEYPVWCVSSDLENRQERHLASTRASLPCDSHLHKPSKTSSRARIAGARMSRAARSTASPPRRARLVQGRQHSLYSPPANFLNSNLVSSCTLSRTRCGPQQPKPRHRQLFFAVFAYHATDFKTEAGSGLSGYTQFDFEVGCLCASSNGGGIVLRPTGSIKKTYVPGSLQC